MKLILNILSGSKCGQRIEIGPSDSRTIGRSSASQCSFADDDHMSSLHCEVENFGDHAEVRDRGSTNKTWLNNQAITRSALKEGDRLRAGKTLMGVVCESTISMTGKDSGSAYSTLPLKDMHSDRSDSVPVQPLRAQESQPEASRHNSPPMSSAQSKPIDPLPPEFDQRGPLPADYESANARQAVSGLEYAAGLAPRPDAVASASHYASAFQSNGSPIETGSAVIEVEISGIIARAPDNVARRPDSPLSDSVLWLDTDSSDDMSAPERRRFRQYERSTDLPSISNLRAIVNAMHLKKTVRVIAHFGKVRMITPQSLATATPVYPQMPGAASHLPVSMAWLDWESSCVQNVAMRLVSNDALMVVISEFNTDLDSQIQSVGSQGLPGFCEPGGFLGWSWPSAFISMIQMLGSHKWSGVLGTVIEGVIMVSPTHPDRLLAFASDDLEPELTPLGFRCDE